MNRVARGLVVVLFVACVRRTASSEVEVLIAQFAVAASIGDSATLYRLSDNPDPGKRAAAVHARAPELLAALIANRSLVSSVARGDSLFLAYQISHTDTTSVVTIGLVNTAGSWRIYYFAFPD